MTEQVAERFMEALRESERRRDPAPVAALFAEDAECSSLTRKHSARGREQVRQFWETYLRQFEQIASEFTEALIAGDRAALEWRSRGRLNDGEPVDYRGVSIIEVRGDEVTRFRTYFDSAVFTPGGAKLASNR